MPPKVGRPGRRRRENRAAKPPRRIPQKAWNAEVKREKQACRRLAAAFIDKLGKDLRDEIYLILSEEADSSNVDVEGRKTGKNFYVQPLLRIFSPDYVGDKVAFEAATFLCARSDYECYDIRQLNALLTDNKIHKRVFPYQWLSQLHLTINIQDVTAPRYKANYANDSAIVRHWEEGLDLEWKLHSYLNTTFNSSFSLLLKAERISHMKVHIMLELGSYPYMDSPDTESHMAMLEVERSFLNVLEDMRKPVYDLVHAGARVIITWDEEREPRYQRDMRGDPLQRPLVGLFHLSKKDWEEEKANRLADHGDYLGIHYNQRMIQELSNGGRYCEMFANMLPEFRERWGYSSFRKLVHIGQLWKLDDSECENGFSSGPSTYDGSDEEDEEDEEDNDNNEEDEDDEGGEGDEGDDDGDDDEDDDDDYGQAYYHSDDESDQGDYEASYDDMKQWGF